MVLPAIAVAVVVVLAALDFAAQPRAQTTTSPPARLVQTASGPVCGVTADGQTDYLDIPYAAPPVGKLRWKPPQLQLMRAEHPTGTRVEDVSAFSRGLKQLAGELDWPVIAVRQLDRGIEQRPGVVTTRTDRRLRCFRSRRSSGSTRVCRPGLDGRRSVTPSHVSTLRRMRC